MAKSLKRILLTLLILCVFVCGAMFVAACGGDENTNDNSNSNTDIDNNDDDTGDDSDDDTQTTVTYSVTVTADTTDVVLTSLKAQWYKGTTKVGAAVTLSAEGKASVTLDSGSYTVELEGLDSAKYTYTKASVTASNPSASISITTKQQNILVSVSVPAGMTLPSGVAVQAYSGEDEVGSPVTLTGTTARVTLPAGGTYTLTLKNLPDYLECQPVAVSGSVVTISVTAKTVQYTVNVNTGAESLSGLTVTFYKGTEPVEGATDVAVTEGVATATLTAGDYTFKLNGIDATQYLVSGNMSVSATVRSVTITVTKVAQQVTVNTSNLPTNVVEADIANLKLKLVTVSGNTTIGEPVALVDNVARFAAPLGDYRVEVVNPDGATVNYACAGENLSATQNNVTVTLGVAAPAGTTTVQVINGGYYIYAAQSSVRYAAPAESGNLRYILDIQSFGEDAVKANPAASCSTGAIFVSDTQVSEVLAASASGYFGITRTESKCNFIVKVTTETAPESGTRFNPINISSGSIKGEHAADAGKTEVYFRLPRLTAVSTKYHLIVPEYVEFYRLNTPSDALTSPQTTQWDYEFLANGNTPANCRYYICIKLASGAPDETELKFTFERNYDNGTAPQRSVELQYGVAQSNIAATNGEHKEWYTFTPDETKDYRITLTGLSEYKSLIVCTGYVWGGHASGIDGWEEDWEPTGPVTHNSSNNLSFTLTESTEYYIALTLTGNYSYSITVSEDVPNPGEKGAPYDVTNTGAEKNDVGDKLIAGTTVYFKHTVTAESLNSEEKVKFHFETVPSSHVINFYDDAEYSHELGHLRANDNSTQRDIEFENLDVDSVIYFTISGYNQDAIFYINPPEKMNVVEVGEEITLTVAPNDNTFSVEAPAGTYVLSYTVQLSGPPLQITFGTLHDQYIYSSGSGSFDVTITENESLHIRNNDMSAIEITITLEKSVPKLKADGVSIQVEMTGTQYSNASVDIILDSSVEAGKYSLTISANVANPVPYSITPEGGTPISSQTIGTSESVFEITIPGGATKITVSSPQLVMAASITFTVKLEAVVDDSVKLTVNEPLTVTSKPVDYKHSLEIFLNDVPAGDYSFVMSEFQQNDFKGIFWYVLVNDTYNVLCLGNKNDGIQGQGKPDTSTSYDAAKPPVINIPEGCEKITLTTIGRNNQTTLSTQHEADTSYLTREVTTTIKLVPYYNLTIDEPLAVELVPDSDSHANTVLHLRNVDAGDYMLAMDVGSNSMYFMATWNVQIKDVSVPLTDTLWGYEGPVRITIPESCTEITITGGNFSEAFEVTFTLTSAAGALKGDIIVDEEKSVELKTDSWGVSDEMTVYLEEGVTYVLSVTVPEGKQVNVNDINSKTNASGDHLLDAGTLQTEFTVKETGLVELKVADASAEGGFSVTLLITAKGDLTVGQGSTFSVPSDNDASILKTVWLNPGTYVITLEYEDLEENNNIGIADENEILGGLGGIILDSYQAKTVSVTVETARLYTLRFFDGSYTGSVEITVTISFQGITVGEDFTVEIPSDSESFYLVRHEVYLKAGTYTITISGGDIGTIQVNDPDNHFDPEESTVIAAGSTTATVTVEESCLVTLVFLDTGATGGQSFTVRIDKA